MNKKEKEVVVNTLLSEIRMAKAWACDWLNTEDKEIAEAYQMLTSRHQQRANAIIDLLGKLGMMTGQQMVELDKDIYNYIMGKELK